MPFSVLGSCATAFLVVTATYLIKRALDSRSHDVNLLRGPSPASWLFGASSTTDRHLIWRTQWTIDCDR
ncbi:unnamed protein product [Mycena citricolor]|uniref:Uncharacterized protein n=1 Tax=Mycena citricolor TaxID=2018698 RepID=A0AAD2H9V1_9AGAR|nr:unnamed protein product [Mycena citricolor]